MGTRLNGDWDRLSDRAVTMILVALAVVTLAAIALTSRGDVDMPANTPDIMEDTRP